MVGNRFFHLFIAGVFVSAAVYADPVSIIMPAYNSEAYIAQAIRSVQAQTHRDWQLVIVDDGSTDGTAELVRRFQSRDNRIQLVQLEQNGGVANARNQGLKAAAHSYVAFLDSDDMWLPEKLEKQLDFMKSKNIAFSYTAYRKMSTDGTEQSHLVTTRDTIQYKQLLKQNVVPVFTVMLDLEKTGSVEFQEGYNEDFKLWIDLMKRGFDAHALNEDLGRLRRISGSLSSNKAKAAAEYWKILRGHEKLSFTKSGFYFLNYAARSAVKYAFRFRMTASAETGCSDWHRSIQASD